MLEEIAVENLVIIDRVHVEFHSGFNAISGETGVGKSLLLRAINILLGGRLKPHEPAQGTCRIEGRFRVDPSTLGESFMGFASDDPTEWVVRVLKNAGGKQRCYINGAMASRREVTKLGHLLADIQGQDDRQRLLKPAVQLAILDRFAKAESLVESWREIWGRYSELLDQSLHREERLSELRDRIDLGSFQAEELERASVEPGEVDQLRQQLGRVRAAEQTFSALEGARARLSEITDGARASGADLEHLSEVDERLAPIAESLFELVSDANEILASVTATADSDDSDSVDLDELETRLNWLQDLSRKHRTDEDGLVERLSSLRQELESMGFEVEDLDALDERRQQLESEAVELALQIREVRIEAATRLESATASELRELGMPHAHLRFDDGIDGDGVTVNDLNASGAGRPRIVFQANPGAGWEDLSVAASGGELSRVLLSLHALFAELHAIPLVVFDEIEAGVGPRLGLTLGTRLASLSRSHQVLAITHLPQLASFADRHLKITKKVRGSSTSVQVNVIEGKARADELAEMLGGGDKGLARQQAASLLKEAESRADS